MSYRKTTDRLDRVLFIAWTIVFLLVLACFLAPEVRGQDYAITVGDSGRAAIPIYDEDAMGSDSATGLATQQSIKAYHDNNENIFAITTHAYDGAGNWTLSTAEAKSLILVGQNATGAVNILAPATSGKVFFVRNEDNASAITIKVDGQTGVAVAAGKTAGVWCNGVDYKRLSADETH